MLTIHHLNNSRSQRVLWLLEELGLPYEIVRYERDPKTMLAPPSLRAVHPLGKSPVLVDDGRAIAESGAILEYLIERHGDGRLAPAAGTDDAIRYRYWMHYAEGSLMPPLLLKLLFSRMPESAPLLLRPVVRIISGATLQRFVEPQLRTHLDFLEQSLGQTEWFAGNEFSAADIQMSFPLEAAKARGGLDTSRPRLMAFLRRIAERPAYQKALERGGPYELLS